MVLEMETGSYEDILESLFYKLVCFIIVHYFSHYNKKS